MEMLREYTCWTADSWRTEGMLDLHYPEVTVNVRDLEADEIDEILIKGIERFINISQLK